MTKKSVKFIVNKVCKCYSDCKDCPFYVMNPKKYCKEYKLIDNGSKDL